MSVIYLLVFIQLDKSKSGTFTKNCVIKISETMNHYSLEMNDILSVALQYY